MKTGQEPIYELVRTIPAGRVLGYKAVGQLSSVFFGARQVGQVMAAAWDDDLPWWRVTASDGSMATARRDPRLAAEQRRLLESEGVGFNGDRVARAFFWDGEQ
ncbi:MAG: MGMT family protein [Chthonomonas sp.]|nr:MGMT family protein [Chthonomonas sp.]